MGDSRDPHGKRPEDIGELVDVRKCVNERKVGRPDGRVYPVGDPMHDCTTAIQRESSGVRIELASIGSENNFVDQCAPNASLRLHRALSEINLIACGECRKQ